MKNMQKIFAILRRAAFAAMFACSFVLTFSSAQAQKVVTGLKPANVAGVNAGLQVKYNFVHVRHVDQCEAAGKSSTHDVLKHLNYLDNSGPVLTTEEETAVCARISGLMHFEKPGNYDIQMNSNDGVRFKIGGQLIGEDPEVHAEQVTDPVTLAIKEPGWYDIYIVYFQRKGTWALELLWTPPWKCPPDSDFDTCGVPAKYLGHHKK